jgi:hypothetical protein
VRSEWSGSDCYIAGDRILEKKKKKNPGGCNLLEVEILGGQRNI